MPKKKQTVDAKMRKDQMEMQKRGNYRHRNLFPRNGYKWLNRKIFDDNSTSCCE